jgi:hypothetical protein
MVRGAGQCAAARALIGPRATTGGMPISIPPLVKFGEGERGEIGETPSPPQSHTR